MELPSSMRPSQRSGNELAARNEAIVLRLRDLSDLLDLDPSPLSHGAIKPEAETYIVRKAKQLSGTGPIRLTIELPSTESKSEEKAEVEDAIANHFRNAAYSEATDLRELFRSGCKALLLGLLVLATCLFSAWFLTDRFPDRPIARVLQESFVILGWVSMWRPIEIFLYEWLPHVRLRNLFIRLSNPAVTIEDNSVRAEHGAQWDDGAGKKKKARAKTR